MFTAKNRRFFRNFVGETDVDTVTAGRPMFKPWVGARRIDRGIGARQRAVRAAETRASCSGVFTESVSLASRQSTAATVRPAARSSPGQSVM